MPNDGHCIFIGNYNKFNYFFILKFTGNHLNGANQICSVAASLLSFQLATLPIEATQKNWSNLLFQVVLSLSCFN